MNFEQRVLAIVNATTFARAYFFNGTLFVETQDSAIATRVYNALSVNMQTVGICYGKCGQSETSYDFI